MLVQMDDTEYQAVDSGSLYNLMHLISVHIRDDNAVITISKETKCFLVS